MKSTKTTLRVNLIWYVTGHGFGHASRTIALARELLKKDPNLAIIFVSREKQLEFIRKSLVRFKQRIHTKLLKIDLGLVLKGFDKPDKETMEGELEHYLKNLQNTVYEETNDLSNYDPVAIFSDCVPHAFLVAKKLGVKGVLISNFTWLKMYEKILNKKLNTLKSLYKNATNSFIIVPYDEEKYGETKTINAWFCREINLAEKTILRNKFRDFEMIIYLGMGLSTEYESKLGKWFEINNSVAFIYQ